MVAIKSLVFAASLFSGALATSSAAASGSAAPESTSISALFTITIPEATVTQTVEISIPTYTDAVDMNVGRWIEALFPPCARNAINNAYNESHSVCGTVRNFRDVRRCVCNHPRFIARSMYGAEASCGIAPRYRVWWLLQGECHAVGIRLGELRAYVDFELQMFNATDPETWGNQTDYPPPPPHHGRGRVSTVTAGTVTLTEYRSTTGAVELKDEQTGNLPPVSETGVPTSTIPLETTAAAATGSGAAAAGNSTSGSAKSTSSGSAAVGIHDSQLFQNFGVVLYALLVATAGFMFAL